MTPTRTRRNLLTATALGLVLVPRQALPQERLPEIVVTTPSPIFTRPETNGVLVGASSFPVGVLPVVERVFAPVTVVPQTRIERETQPRSLGDVLFERPGISATTYAPNAASRPIIRGLDSFRVRIQENGVRTQDVSELGEDHAVPINPLVNDRIEVIRGPATLRYGSQAIGGVVSAENNRVPTFIPIGGVSGRVTGGVSSVDRGTDFAATVDAGHGNVAMHADGFRSSTGDYSTPRGRQFNSATQSQGGAGGVSYVFDRGFAGVSFSHYEALYHIPGGGSAEQRTRLDPRQDKLLARGEYRPESGPIEAIRFTAGGSNYKHREIGLDDDGALGVRTVFKNREGEGRIEAQHVPVFTRLGTFTGAIGFQGSRRDLSTTGEGGGLLRPTDSRNLAVYLFEELALTRDFRLQAAGRVERARVAGTGTDFPVGLLPPPDEPDEFAKRRTFVAKSASFGALHALPFGFTGSVNAQYVERAPASPELFSRGPHDATETFEIGDVNLKKERARTIEVGLRRAEGPLRLDATGYYTRFTGFIYKRLTGVRCGDDFGSCGLDDELDQVVYSQQNATFHGAEIGAQLDVLPVGPGFVGVDAQYDFVRARFDDGTDVPRIPPHRVGGGLFYRGGGWFARAGVLHAFSHTETAAFETKTAGYNLVKAEIGYTQALNPRVHGLAEVTAGIVGNNLLDDVVRNSASFKKDEILLPGRTVRVFVTARF